MPLTACLAATAPSDLTTGDVAERYGLPHWKVLAAIRRGYVPEPKRFFHYRMFNEKDLPEIEAGLIGAGYLTPSKKRAKVAVI